MKIVACLTQVGGHRMIEGIEKELIAGLGYDEMVTVGIEALENLSKSDFGCKPADDIAIGAGPTEKCGLTV